MKNKTKDNNSFPIINNHIEAIIIKSALKSLGFRRGFCSLSDEQYHLVVLMLQPL